jgi:DNA-binding NarL/FixJ family response regulator
VPAANGLEALDEVQRRAFDLALVDIWLPDLTGLELLERLKDLAPGMQVILITCRPTRKTAVLALRLGACDYVKKPFVLRELQVAVRRALTQGHLPAIQERQWAAGLLARARPWLAKMEQTWSSLTEREQQVLVKLAEGKTDAEIAEALGISVKTVGKHVSSIFDKLGVRSRTEAAVWAVRAGVEAVEGENSP